MDPIGYVFLGVIAVATLVQAVVLIGALAAGLRIASGLARRLDALEQDARPQLARLGQIADGLAEVSGRAQRQFADVESAIGDATDRVRRTGEAVERVVQRPTGLLAAALVFSVARHDLARRVGRA